MNPLNITGNKINNLTAIKINGKDNFGRNLWLYKCDCGNFTTALPNNVKNNITKSCGCLKINKKHRRINIVNKKFGKLLVTSFGEYRLKRAYWNCICDCGNTKQVSSLNLRIGKTKSCGCEKYKRYNTTIISVTKWARNIKNIHTNCVKCGSKDKLNAHHIKPVCMHDNLKRDYTNGISLCQDCHIKFHTIYGDKINGTIELSNFLKLNNIQEIFLDTFIGYRDKNGLEDLKKAKHYLELLIQLEYETSKVI
jgi:hypothetical protein